MGGGGQLWLPRSELPYEVDELELVQCGDIFFDVVGFSDKRSCYLITPIKIDGAADGLEEEMSDTSRNI